VVAQPEREFLSVPHVGGCIGVLEYLGIALEEALVILGGLVGYGGGGHGGLGERGVTVCSASYLNISAIYSRPFLFVPDPMLNSPVFDLFVVGSGGGPDETNLSAYVLPFCTIFKLMCPQLSLEIAHCAVGGRYCRS
jgi:hypothetical protein